MNQYQIMQQNNISGIKKHGELSCIRQHVDSERRLGEYSFSRHFQSGFSKRVFKESRTISKGGSKVFPISKEFQSFSKEFPRDFKAFQRGFQRVVKGFQSVSKEFS